MQSANKQRKKNNKARTNRNESKAKQFASIPAAYSVVSRSTAPRITGRSNGVTVTHRERVCEVDGSTGLLVYPLNVNPGLPDTFPWLSGIARNFEHYKFQRLRFSFETMSKTSESGLVMLALDYDAGDPAPETENVLCGYAGSVSTPVYRSAVMDCPAQRMRALGGIYAIRTTALVANRDIKTYDVGTCYVGSIGSPAPFRAGTLWVEYSVELITPQISQVTEEMEDSARVVAGGVINTAAPFGSAPTLLQGLLTPVLGALNDTITFKEPGEYMIKSNFVGTGFTGNPPAIGGTVTATRTTPTVNAAATSLTEYIFVKVLAPLSTLVISFAGVATSLTASGSYFAPYKYANI